MEPLSSPGVALFFYWQFFFYKKGLDLTLGYQDAFLMEKNAEILCDGFHYTFLRVQQTDNKRLFLCKVTIFVEIATF